VPSTDVDLVRIESYSDRYNCAALDEIALALLSVDFPRGEERNYEMSILLFRASLPVFALILSINLGRAVICSRVLILRFSHTSVLRPCLVDVTRSTIPKWGLFFCSIGHIQAVQLFLSN
jgi:hypothetical protein